MSKAASLRVLPVRVRQVVKLLLVLGEVSGERLDQCGAFAEGETPQLGPTHGPGVLHHAGEIDALTGDGGHRLPGTCVDERRRRLGSV